MENKKMFFSKKASGYILGKKPIYFIITLICLTISFLMFSYAISKEVSSTAYIPNNLEANILINRLLNSPYCFAYQDEETGRAYPRIIDLEKFNEKNLEDCYSTEDSNLKSFKLTLKSPELNIPPEGNSDEKKNKNFVLTQNWGASRYTQTSQYVLIHYKENFYRGKVLIAMQK